MRKNANRQSGFTLVELMIVVVVIGVLAAIALPSYQNSVRKSRRSDAHSLLMEVANRQEQFFSNNNTYTDDPADLGYTATDGEFRSPEDYYQVTLAAPGGGALTTGFVATATPATDSAQAEDGDCLSMVYDNTGLKSPVACW